MKKNVAGQRVGAQMVSSTDGSNFTGTVTVYVTIDAGTQSIGSVGSGICTHEGNGYHTYAPSQAETNGDLVAFTFIGTGAVSSTVQIYTGFPQSVDNATDISTILADTNDIQTRLPAALVSGRMDVSVGAIASGISPSFGSFTITDGLIISASTTNRSGIQATGNGTGAGILAVGGATGPGIEADGGSTSGDGILATGTLLGYGINAQGTGSGRAGIFGQANTGGAPGIRGQGSGSGAGFLMQGGSNGNGLTITGGTTAGNGINITTTSGHGVNIAPVGTNMHGIVTTGGNGGTSDGFRANAGTGGVPIRGDITGNITGNISGTVGQVSIKKNTALSNFEFAMTDSTNHNPTTGLTVSGTRSIDGGAFASLTNAVSEVGNGIYKIDLAAADLNGNVITLRFTATGADDLLITIVTQS